MPTLPYNLTATVVIQTVVTSLAPSTNNVATVSIQNAGTTLWSQVLIQSSNLAVLPEMSIGSGTAKVVIHAGGTLTLQVPTALQNGYISANLVWDNGDTKNQILEGQIVSWSLTDK